MKIAEFIHKFAALLQNAIYPKNCFFCGKTDFYVCPDCLKNCEAPLRFYVPYLDNLIIGGSYDEPALKKAVIFLKYRGVWEIAENFGPLLLKRLEENFLLKTSFDNIIAPIPISDTRKRERGFNQALLLGEAVSKLSGIEIKDGLLEKIVDTKPQVKIYSRKERLKNVKCSFKVNDKILSSLGELSNLRIILVDDVVTTGATMSEAAKALKKAGVKSVIGLAVAKG